MNFPPKLNKFCLFFGYFSLFLSPQKQFPLPKLHLYKNPVSPSLTLAAYLFQCVSMLVFKCSPAMSLILSLIPVYSVLPFQRIPPCSQTIVLNGTFLQGGLSNTSGATISFVLCANTMYGNNLASNKPVGMLCCPLEGKDPQLTSSPFQAFNLFYLNV